MWNTCGPWKLIGVGILFALGVLPVTATTITGDPDVISDGPLTVTTDQTSTRHLKIVRPTTTNSTGMQFQNSVSGFGQSDGFFFGLDQNSDAQLLMFENKGLGIGTNSQTRIYVAPNGQIGVGTSTPNRKLQIFDGTGAAVQASFINGDTGSTSTDGFLFGINGQEQPVIWNFENTDMQFATNGAVRATIKAGGNVGIGTSNPTTKLEVAGEVKMTVANITGGADLAEKFEVKSPVNVKASPMPGMVVCIDPVHPGELVLSSKAYDKTVAGVISGAGGLSTGMTMGQTATLADGAHPVALTGRVYCYADAANEAITPGDLLTTSEIPGHAMKVTDHAKAMGSIIGKAMTPLAKGKQGFVLVLVSLQ